MGTNRIKKSRFIPIWQEEKEIKWLEEMSHQGWHLVQKGYISYWFEEGDKKEYIYRYDFKLTVDKDYDDYLQIFKDSGWTLVGEFANWHYFRSEKDSGATDIYSDVESKKVRYKRILILIAAIAFFNFIIVINNSFLISLVTGSFSEIPGFLFALWGLQLLVVALLGYTAVKIIASIRRLNKSIHE